MKMILYFLFVAFLTCCSGVTVKDDDGPNPTRAFISPGYKPRLILFTDTRITSHARAQILNVFATNYPNYIADAQIHPNFAEVFIAFAPATNYLQQYSVAQTNLVLPNGKLKFVNWIVAVPTTEIDEVVLAPLITHIMKSGD